MNLKSFFPCNRRKFPSRVGTILLSRDLRGRTFPSQKEITAMTLKTWRLTLRGKMSVLSS
jgi:hypothetical protein